MNQPDDIELLRQFADYDSEAAFSTLVARYINLVYSAAFRHVGNPHHAEEITQAVFIILARKARQLRAGTILSGWLYQTARLTAANYLRTEIRRARREQEAHMQSLVNDPQASRDEAWPQIAPLLDAAMGGLNEADRNAIVLRFFENKSMGEIAAAMRVPEATGRKRVTRAVERLRTFFTKRGVTLSAVAIAGAVSANSVQAAPVGLVVTVTAAAAKGAVVGGSTLTLIKGALKVMAWMKMKTAIVVGVGVLLAAGTTTVVVKEFRPDSGPEKYFLEMNWETFQKVPPYFIVRPTHYSKVAGNGTTALGTDTRAVGRNMNMLTMIQFAYNYHNQTRTVLPSEKLPAGGFDFLVTVPEGLGKFQAEVKRQFGYEAHKETRDTDALVLKVRKQNVPGLKANSGNKPSQRQGKLFIDWSAYPISSLVGQLEGSLSTPVVDQTGLKGSYDVRLDWKQGSSVAEKAKLRQAVVDQLGLELVPAKMPIEMLVIERVK